MASIPNSGVPIAGGQPVTPHWYNFFADLSRLVTRFLVSDTSTKVIDGGEITISRFGLVVVDTEEEASTDDLTTINGSVAGAVIVLRQAADGRDVTAKDGTGNLSLAGDCAFSDADDTLTLIGTGSGWLEVSRSNNA